MFGMPDSAGLSQAVFVLTRSHERTAGEHTGQEPPLLALLEVAIKSDTSGASGGGGGSTRAASPMDVTALHLWQTIAQTISEYWPGRGHLAHAKLPLIDRLTWWTETVAGTDNEPHLEEMCDYWIGQIRELLEPSRRVPIRGGQCARCKEFQVLGTNPDGERVYGPCLLAHISEDPVRIECLGCGGTWYGNTELQLLELALVN